MTTSGGQLAYQWRFFLGYLQRKTIQVPFFLNRSWSLCMAIHFQTFKKRVLKSRNILKVPLSHLPTPFLLPPLHYFPTTSSPGAIRDQSIVKASTSVALKFPFKMVPADIVFLFTGKSVVFVYSSNFYLFNNSFGSNSIANVILKIFHNLVIGQCFHIGRNVILQGG